MYTRAKLAAAKSFPEKLRWIKRRNRNWYQWEQMTENQEKNQKQVPMENQKKKQKQLPMRANAVWALDPSAPAAAAKQERAAIRRQTTNRGRLVWDFCFFWEISHEMLDSWNVECRWHCWPAPRVEKEDKEEVGRDLDEGAQGVGEEGVGAWKVLRLNSRRHSWQWVRMSFLIIYYNLFIRFWSWLYLWGVKMQNWKPMEDIERASP